MKKFLNPQHPWFIPLWRRVLVVGICALWALLEFATGSPSWGILFGALGVYCAHQFFIVFDPTPPED
jgi:hypothetical protein